MTDNIYEAPQAELSNEETLQEFYAVSIKKFCILFFATYSLYSVYWFYRNWHLFKAFHQAKLWAPMRGIFSIFFAHSLFAKVGERIQERGLSYDWSPKSIATGYVVFVLAENALERLAEKSIAAYWTAPASIACIFVIGYLLVIAQRAINLAIGDATGSSNAQITIANICWCVVGALIWLAVILGVLEVYGLISLE